METEPSFDAADLADAILGTASPPITTEPETHRAIGPREPITQETPVVPAWAAPPPPPVRGWTDVQRALFALALIGMFIALVGIAAMGGSSADPARCPDAIGLFDDSGC